MTTTDALAAPTGVLAGAPRQALKDLVLGKLTDSVDYTAIAGHQFLAAVNKQNLGLFVVDGNFSRAHFKQALREAETAGLNKSRIVVYATTATYSGAGIFFQKFDALGINPSDLRDTGTPHTLPPVVINLTPSWGEVGNIFYRLAATGEARAVEKMKKEMARAFAACEAYSQLLPTLTPEQAANAKAVFAREMTKQGFA